MWNNWTRGDIGFYDFIGLFSLTFMNLYGTSHLRYYSLGATSLSLVYFANVICNIFGCFFQLVVYMQTGL